MADLSRSRLRLALRRTFIVRITEPAGNTVLTGFDTVIRATSGSTPAANNRTIDRLYTGFVRLDKAYTVSNATGVGGATDAVPGAVITYNITYTNVSTSNGDANCVKLTAQNVVITEDGLAAPNNWGTFTTHTGTPSDSGSGVVVIVSATKYTDTIASLAPGASESSRSNVRLTSVDSCGTDLKSVARLTDFSL